MKISTVEWKVNEDQIFYDTTILHGYPETFNKAHGYGFDARGDVSLNIKKNINTQNYMDWSIPSEKTLSGKFSVSSGHKFTVSDSQQQRSTFITDEQTQGTPGIWFYLYPGSGMTFKNLNVVSLANSKFESYSLDVEQLEVLVNFEANDVRLFRYVDLSGNVKISVESFIFHTGCRVTSEGLWNLAGKSSLNYNVILQETISSEMDTMTCFNFKENTSANIYAEVVKIWDKQEKTFIMSGNSKMNIHTKVFEIESINMQHPNIAISISEQANVTIHPFNECLPVDALKEINLPEDERTLWAGMFNFKYGSTGGLKIMGTGNAFQFNAMAELKLLYLDSNPVDILKTFNATYTDGNMLLTLK
ncbi:hypothetical protein NP681_004504 [Salmonella enterica]|nr:hypothetical protein [Salmonella enterica]EJR3519429.1 hypothetical protein [Salmonella enterica]